MRRGRTSPGCGKPMSGREVWVWGRGRRGHRRRQWVRDTRALRRAPFLHSQGQGHVKQPHRRRRRSRKAATPALVHPATAAARAVQGMEFANEGAAVAEEVAVICSASFKRA